MSGSTYKQLKKVPLEPIGKRIARLRNDSGWTQQSLADRLAISRVAISHIEMDLTFPGERTITLLSGIFKLTPHELVAGTTYPKAKADRLPETVCWYTQLEQDLALLDNDLKWLKLLSGQFNQTRLLTQVQGKWSKLLSKWMERTIDDREREKIAAAQEKLAAACNTL
jgi:transcriptional regulator with XRE-family HTH domain